MVRLGELDERSDPDCEHKLLPGLSNNERLVTCADRFVDVPVVQSIVHERFDTPYRQNDIALLRLNTSITPTSMPCEIHIRIPLTPPVEFMTSRTILQ